MATVIQQPQSKSDVVNNALGMGIGNAVQSGYSAYTNRADEMALQKSIGALGNNPTPRQILDAVTNTHTYSPESKQTLFKNYLGAAQFEELQRSAKVSEEESRLTRKAKGEQEVADRAEKKEEKLKEKQEKKAEAMEPLKVGLKTIARMKEIGTKGNIGRGSQFTKVLGGETAKDYGEYEQLGKSLIQLSTNIPIRNRQEFEVLAHNLYDPSIPDSQRAGVLDAIESIIKGSLQESGIGVEKGQKVELTNFPPASDYKGEEVVGPNGVKYYSDGESWRLG